MTEIDAPAADLRLPDRPRDAHIAAAEALLRRLAAAFPTAGLGITGSVGMGLHHAASDIDMVMVDASFPRDVQFATLSEGIRSAVVCLRPAFGAERERRWMLASGGDVRIVSMVRSAFVARDPSGWLGQMQRTVARLDQERRDRRHELAVIRRDDALKLVRALHGGTAAGDEPLQMQLFDAVVDGWFLRHGLAMDTRQETERMLVTIAGRDPALAALLRDTIPLTHRSLSALLRAVDHVFEPDRGG